MVDGIIFLVSAMVETLKENSEALPKILTLKWWLMTKGKNGIEGNSGEQGVGLCW